MFSIQESSALIVDELSSNNFPHEAFPIKNTQIDEPKIIPNYEIKPNIKLITHRHISSLQEKLSISIFTSIPSYSTPPNKLAP